MRHDEKVKHSRDLIAGALQKDNRVGVAVSGGKDSVVLMDLSCEAVKFVTQPRLSWMYPDLALQALFTPLFFCVTTPHKPPETAAIIRDLEERYGVPVHVFRQLETVSADLYKTNPDECCRRLKVEPTWLAIRDLQLGVWITGRRADEGECRGDLQETETNMPFPGLFKLNPLKAWTATDIWKYTAYRHLPVHPWYAEGYESLGCTPCTRKTDETEPERAGRWTGTAKQGGECGIHTLRAGC